MKVRAIEENFMKKTCNLKFNQYSHGAQSTEIRLRDACGLILDAR